MQRAFVFIDGSNFYHRVKILCEHIDPKPRLLEFNYRDFISQLVIPNQLMGARYYVGAIRRKSEDLKSEKLYADQQKLLARLERHGIDRVLGTLIRHPDDTFHEKGVDVRLAVEMIRFARQNRYDVAHLLSSDTDLVAAIEEVHSLGKKVYYIGTAKGQSFGLTKIADDTRLLRLEDIKSFLPTTTM